VQDDAEDHRHEAGDDRRASRIRSSTRSARSASRISCSSRDAFGEFTACTQLSDLQVREAEDHGVLCPKDGGDIVERKSRRGKVFYGCANYPDCDFTLWNRPSRRSARLRRAVPRGEDHEKHGRQLVCNNEECSYARQAEELQPPDR
jgi:ssDNA-binding Zn-finger/Zn-ribbon topoisomerase 1